MEHVLIGLAILSTMVIVPLIVGIVLNVLALLGFSSGANENHSGPSSPPTTSTSALPPEGESVPMSLYERSIDRNAPRGTCVESEINLYSAEAFDAPIVRCAQPHWAEILGYRVLAQPGAQWPGAQQAYEEAVTACEKVVSQQPEPSEVTLAVLWPGERMWGLPQYPPYATCLAVPESSPQRVGANP